MKGVRSRARVLGIQDPGRERATASEVTNSAEVPGFLFSAGEGHGRGRGGKRGQPCSKNPNRTAKPGCRLLG